MTTALVLVGLVGVALVTLTLALANESHRTGAQAADAQLRQLVHAASIEANEAIRRGEAKAGDTRTLKLPDELASGGAKVEVRFTQRGNALAADVDASLGGRHERQQTYSP